jgi:hypothetical protein
MAHFAEIDALHKVIQVVVLDDKDTQDSNDSEVESIGAKYLHDAFSGTWLRTSYNTHGGVHILNGEPFRKNYAGIGFSYDVERDAFIPPSPFPSWTVNEATCLWDPPVALPDDSKRYEWNEDTQAWDEIK